LTVYGIDDKAGSCGAGLDDEVKRGNCEA